MKHLKEGGTKMAFMSIYAKKATKIGNCWIDFNEKGTSRQRSGKGGNHQETWRVASETRLL